MHPTRILTRQLARFAVKARAGADMPPSLRLTLFALLCPAQVAAGQAQATASTGSVAGHVFGKADRPLAGVEITGPSTAATIYTDSMGRFGIVLPVGDRHVTLRKLGYKPLSTGILVTPAAVTEVRVTLEPCLRSSTRCT